MCSSAPAHPTSSYLAFVCALCTLYLLFIGTTHAQRPYYLASWGSNLNERLGAKSSGGSKSATLLDFRTATNLRPDADLNIKHIVPGSDYAMAVTMSNQILVWGGNAHCQLGISPCGQPGQVQDAPTWMDSIPTGTSSYNILNLLSAGTTSFAQLATDSSLRLYGWGSVNATGSNALLLPQITDSSDVSLSPTAIGVSGQPSWELVSGASCAGSLCVAITSDGVIGWGDAYAPYNVFPCPTLTDGVCNFSADASFSALLGGRVVKQACLATERDTSNAKVGARVVLVTDDHRLLVAGAGMDFVGTTSVTLGWTSIVGTTFNAACSSIDEVKCGNNFVLVRCNNSVLSVGKNSFLALGIPGQSVVRSVNSPALVDLPLEPLENVRRIAAGKNSGYAVTDQGRVLAWGSALDCGLGTCGGGSDTSEPKAVKLNSVTRSNYVPNDVAATSEANGAFVIFAELPIGTCPLVPQTMMEHFWCNQDNYYMFLALELSTGSYEMPLGIGFEGSLTLNGDISFEIPEGMKLRGKMHAKGSASLKLKRHSDVVGNLILDQNSITSLDNATLIITNGSLELSPTSSMVLSNLVFAGNDTDDAALSPVFDLVDGFASLQGTLEIIVTPEMVSQMTREVNASAGPSSVSMRAMIVKGDEETVEPRVPFVTVTLLQPTDDPCLTFTGAPVLTPSSLVVFVSLEKASCEPKSNSQTDQTSTPLSKAQTTKYIIIGSVVGAVAAAAIIAALIVLNVDGLKRSWLPFREG